MPHAVYLVLPLVCRCMLEELPENIRRMLPGMLPGYEEFDPRKFEFRLDGWPTMKIPRKTKELTEDDINATDPYNYWGVHFYGADDLNWSLTNYSVTPGELFVSCSALGKDEELADGSLALLTVASWKGCNEWQAANDFIAGLHLNNWLPSSSLFDFRHPEWMSLVIYGNITFTIGGTEYECTDMRFGAARFVNVIWYVGSPHCRRANVEPDDVRHRQSLRDAMLHCDCGVTFTQRDPEGLESPRDFVVGVVNDTTKAMMRRPDLENMTAEEKEKERQKKLVRALDPWTQVVGDDYDPVDDPKTVEDYVKEVDTLFGQAWQQVNHEIKLAYGKGSQKRLKGKEGQDLKIENNAVDARKSCAKDTHQKTLPRGATKESNVGDPYMDDYQQKQNEALLALIQQTKAKDLYTQVTTPKDNDETMRRQKHSLDGGRQDDMMAQGRMERKMEKGAKKNRLASAKRDEDGHEDGDQGEDEDQDEDEEDSVRSWIKKGKKTSGKKTKVTLSAKVMKAGPFLVVRLLSIVALGMLVLAVLHRCETWLCVICCNSKPRSSEALLTR
eukprot:gnl/MRDRNA2_/MRDRNA2_127672_c0_seq1.p1 gnl/MRDRNA2_/MRDRNA2_127672_c0~~gnl/MRDRNA2_/MRDRNA2_127672_c0_seq1.p1  ORF type:complete len:557 (+),score=112.51 gnl/MRDRNA2_/MRDRNA2_127672_c0_seq1:142-1812(+)